MRDAQLPEGLARLLRRVDLGSVETGELVLGPVIFRPLDDATVSLVDALADDRWSTMPPALLPFATDAVGNRFCLVCGQDYPDPGERPVVYWMYETTLAVPVASCFRHFLDWIGLVSEIYIRRGADETQTRAHFDNVVRPQLRELGVARDFFALTTSPVSPVGSLHLGMMRVDPDAAGSRLVAAHRARIDGRQKDAIVHARAALKSFPQFLGALWFLVNFDNARTRVIGYKDLVRRLMRMPLVYRGDAMMSEFGDIPSPRLSDIVARVGKVVTVRESAEDPIADLMLFDDVYGAANWLRVAVELANLQRFERAHIASLNAAYLACDADVLRDIWRFQRDLYTALQWDWEADMIGRQLRRAAPLVDLHKKIL